MLGALLRPAAVPAFTQQPTTLRDGCIPVAAPELHAVVRASVPDLATVVGDIEVWLAERACPLTAEARQANRLADLAIADSSITTVPELADALGPLRLRRPSAPESRSALRARAVAYALPPAYASGNLGRMRGRCRRVGGEGELLSWRRWPVQERRNQRSWLATTTAPG